MAKDPAFLFYTNDFQSGAQFFTNEQVGKFLRLLMAQHQHGHLSEKQLMLISQSYDDEVMQKFVQDEQGLFYNKRLETEIGRRKKFTDSRSKNKLGKVKSKEDEPKTTDKTGAAPAVNTNQNSLVLNVVEVSRRFKEQEFEVKRGLMSIYELSELEYTKTVDMFCMDESHVQKEYTEVIRHFKNWVKENYLIAKKVTGYNTQAFINPEPQRKKIREL